jgi:hypothetical protein
MVETDRADMRGTDFKALGKIRRLSGPATAALIRA